MRSAVAVALALAATWSMWAAPVFAQGAEPVYWRQRIFFIPYQAGAEPAAAKIDKVQLLVARGGGDWAMLQEAEPHVRGFSYHAAADGEYWFALRMSDRRGNFSPAQITQPQLRVVVDTQAPAIQLAASLEANGQIIVRYEARDLQLKPETMRLEVQADGQAWQPAALGPPDVSQPDRVTGQLAWKSPLAAGDIRIRATIEDRAGNQGAATADASLVGPLLSPAAGPPLNLLGGDSQPRSAFDRPGASLAASPSVRSTIDWPASPPLQNPYTARSADAAPRASAPSSPFNRTPAQLVADAGPTLSPSRSSSPFSAPAPGVTAPPLFSPPSSASNPAPQPPAVDDGWSSAAPGSVAPSAAAPVNATPAKADANGAHWVNSPTFDVDYDLQTVGPWGVAKVELWATRDNGQSWTTFGVDDDNRAPIRVTAPGAGVYGFRLVVDSANGAAAPTPQTGDQPELVIGVDLQPPQAELLAAGIGQGALADHLLIRWSAGDDNLESRPVGLFFSSQPDGPWTTIATDLENSGQYAWRLLRQVPEKLFLRMEVRDAAGNVTVRQSAAPVVLELPQPTGRLRSVRPVPDDPSRFRTAAGASHTPTAQ